MKHKSAQKYTQSIGIIILALLLILLKTDTSLAQNMTPEQQQMMQQYQQQSNPQPQQQPQQPQPQSQQPQQYQMTPDQQKQYQQYQQMTPQQQQQIQQQYQQQNSQQTYPQQQQATQQQQNNQGQQQQYQLTPEQQKKLTPDQQQQYQKYQQSTPQERQQMQEQYKQQYQQVQQQYQQYREEWKQQAAQNGFQISTPPPNAFQQQGQQGQTPNQPPLQNSFALPSLDSFPTIRGQFFVGSANGAPNINLNDKNTSVILGNDNSLKAKRPDGTEVEINKEAFEKINAAIKLETGSEISQNGNAYIMKRGKFEAETKFPISFNVATKTFSVQTPAGTKEVAVLPDQAVEKAIQSGVISVANTPQGQTSGSKVQLSELNNKPVYQVEGSSKQKMFGFFPVAIPKTTFVSAENGNVVTTNQNIFSRFLDTISF